MGDNESELNYGLCSEADEMRVVLVGSAGAGKSATGNSILGERRFVSRASPTSVTLESEKGVCVWDGRRLVVVDTPGFYNRNAKREEVRSDISQCLQLCAPGPHAIVLVLQAGRFSQEEREGVDTIQRAFGKEALKHMVVVFTREDDLGDRTIEEFVSESEPKLRELIAKCGGRYCAFNNRATGDENTRQVEKLIHMIEYRMDRRYFTIENPSAQTTGIGAVIKPFCNRGLAVGAGLGLAVGVAVAVGAGTPFAFMVALMPVGLGVVGGGAYNLYKN